MSTIFLDRDGVINRRLHTYVTCWDDFQFLAGVPRVLAALTREGHRLFVVTNQACVGKGLMPFSALDDLHCHMAAQVAEGGGKIEAVLACPHQPTDGCACRKPAPGLLLRACDEYGVDLADSVLVGDSASDLRAAQAVGVPAILVLTGLGLRTMLSGELSGMTRFQIAMNLAHAARLILASKGRTRERGGAGAQVDTASVPLPARTDGAVASTRWAIAPAGRGALTRAEEAP